MRFDRRDLPMFGIAIALVGLLGLGGVIAQEARYQADARQSVSNALATMDHLQAIESGVTRAESALRGYWLTWEIAFLDDFDADLGEVQAGLTELRGLTLDDALQQERLEELEPVLDRRLALLREGPDRVAGDAPFVPLDARRLSERIHQMIGAMRDTEVHELDTWRETARQRVNTLVAWCRIAALFGVGGGLAALAWLARERKALRTTEEQLVEKHGIIAAILEGTTDGLYAKDLSGRYLQANSASARLIGRTVAEVLGKSDAELFPGQSGEEIAERDGDVLRSGMARTVEVAWPVSGVPRTFLTTRAPFRDAEGRIIGLIGVARDITDRKAQEDGRLREITLLLELGELFQACRNTVDAYGVIARMGARLFPNLSGAVSVFHASRNLIELRAAWGPHTLIDGDGLYGPDDCWALRRGRPHVADGQYGINCRHGGGPGATCCTPLLAQGEVLGVLHIGYQGTMDPVTQRRAAFVAEQISMAIANLELRETLRSQSIRDPLTGLYNRRFAEDALHRELLRAARHEGTVATLTMDLDHFKRINDTFGHDAGDRVLREVGAVLADAAQGDDVASRMGGEELLLLLPGASAEEASARAEQIRARIAAAQIHRDGTQIGPVTVSIGIAIYPDHGRTVDGLLKSGDTALYAAKRSGRNRAVWANALTTIAVVR